MARLGGEGSDRDQLVRLTPTLVVSTNLLSWLDLGHPGFPGRLTLNDGIHYFIGFIPFRFLRLQFLLLPVLPLLRPAPNVLVSLPVPPIDLVLLATNAVTESQGLRRLLPSVTMAHQVSVFSSILIFVDD